MTEGLEARCALGAALADGSWLWRMEARQRTHLSTDMQRLVASRTAARLE